MAQPTNTFSTYDSIGNREDLAEAISRLDTSATPFLSALETVAATSTKHS